MNSVYKNRRVVQMLLPAIFTILSAFSGYALSQTISAQPTEALKEDSPAWQIADDFFW